MPLNTTNNIGSPNRTHPKAVQWAIFLLGLIAIGMVLLSTSRFGVGVTPDSTAYLTTAENLLAGKGYLWGHDQPFTGWPPLFPTLLAAVGLTGIDPVVAARLINALAMGGIVLISGRVFARHIQSKALTIVATLSTAFSLPLLNTSVMAWTEPVFVLLIVLFLVQMGTFLRRRVIWPLLGAGLFAALSSIQRYTGVTVILTGAMVVVMTRSEAPLARRLKQAGVFLCVACAPLTVWAIRNYTLTSMLTGNERVPSRYPLQENISDSFNTITTWFWPVTVALSTRLVIVGIILLVATAAFFLSRYKTERKTRPDTLDLWPAIMFVLVYLPFMIYSHQKGVYDERMEDRYLVPIFVPLFWLIFVGLDRARMLLALTSKTPDKRGFIIIGICAFWLYHPITRSHELISSWMRYGTGGYSTAAWQQSKIVDWLRNHPLQAGESVYSNAPDALHLLTGISATTTPHRSWSLSEFRKNVSATAAPYVIWFDQVRRTYQYELEELVEALPLRERVSLSDGQVYQFLPSTDRDHLGRPVFSYRAVNGTWRRSFTSEEFGRVGRIHSWLIHADSTMESTWELQRPDGTTLTWHPCGPCTISDSTLEFSGQGQAIQGPNDPNIPYDVHVQGTIENTSATGTYRIELVNASGSTVDRGAWRVDLARAIYRLWSPGHKAHQFAIDRKTVRELTHRNEHTWADEGTAFCAYLEGQQPPEAQPVYHFVSPISGKHFYTIFDGERAKLLNNLTTWTDKGTAFYVFSEEYYPAEAKPMHRFWSPALHGHFYTMNEAEKDKLMTRHAQWNYEGIAWYALAPPHRD